MRFYRLYEFLGPALFLPLGYFLWLQRLGDHRMVLLVLSMPVVFAYVVPAWGANHLGLWELRTRWRVGKIRPHNGLVFGAATAVIAWLVSEPPGPLGLLGVIRAAIVLGSVLGFWNWLWDMEAIRAGFLVVYNKAAAAGRGPEAIAADFAPVYFGTFGACYGIAIALETQWLLQGGRWDLYWPLLIATNAAGLMLPVLAYMLWTWVRHGENGLRPHAVPGREAREPAERDAPQASSMLQ